MANDEQRRLSKRALSLSEFCSSYGIGRTRAYEELKAGRLRARKSGRRTIILQSDAENWLRELPTIQPGPA